MVYKVSWKYLIRTTYNYQSIRRILIGKIYSGLSMDLIDCSVKEYYISALNFKFTLDKEPDCFGVDNMFLFENSVSEGLFSISLKYRHAALNDDWSRIQSFIYKVYGTACNFHPIFDCLLLGMESFESRKKRRMNIQDLIPVCLNYFVSYKPEVTCKQKEISIISFQDIQDFPIISCFVVLARIKKNSVYSMTSCTFKRIGICLVGNNHIDFRILYVALFNAVYNCLEIRTASRNQYCNLYHH